MYVLQLGTLPAAANRGINEDQYPSVALERSGNNKLAIATSQIEYDY